MFIQAFQGPVADAEGLRRQLNAWLADLAPGAEGWLGTTAGVTDGGEFIAVVRFESQAAAQRNSDRPEQGQWWADTEPLFAGPVTFHDYTDTDLILDGGSDAAGFVQVIQGRVTDLARARALESELEPQLEESRPDVIGGAVGWDDDGGFTQTVYFTSEAEAREGERRTEGEPASGAGAEWQTLVESARYLDLRDPWLWSP